MLAMEMGPQGIYQIFGTGGHQLGGMFTPGPGAMPPGGPQWLPYIFVRDARRTAEATKELGGLIAHEPTEVPGGDMVFTGVDRQGAMFAAHSKKRVAPPPSPAKRVKATKTATKATKNSTKATKNSTKAAKKSKAANATKKSTKRAKKAAPKKKAASKPSRRR
jgi:predicted enzyme related to lactoylglutathione lyase